MSELKTAIDHILANRAEMRRKVDGEKTKIDNLISVLSILKERLNEIDDAEIMQQTYEIGNALEKLLVAKRQAEIISERFDRKTVNIGVAGNTHAGKTTTLESISGASEDLLPKAPPEYDQASTTAVRSEIYNCKEGEERVEIRFKTESEFVKFVNDYMAALPGSRMISSKEEFRDFNFKNVDCDNQKQKYSLSRLEGIQKGYNGYSKFIGEPSITLRSDKFKEVKQYVSYLYDGKQQYYPAVAEVKIYCTFGNIDEDVQLGLIDLPGFGENKNVDKIMLHGLQTKVDHAIQIFRTVKGGEGIQEKESENYDKVREAVSEVSSFGDYLSFLINVDRSIDNLDNIIKQLDAQVAKQLANKFPHPIYHAAGNSRDEVKEPFLQIVKKLVETLPRMDEEAYYAYKKNLSFDGVKQIVAGISAQIKQKGNIEDDENLLTDKAQQIRYALSEQLDAYLNELDNTVAEPSSKAQEIHDKMAKEAENTWIDCERRMIVIRGQNPYFDELNRLKKLLIYNYSEEMNKSYVVDLDGIKARLVEIFVSCTGNLFSNPTLEDVIATLKECGNIKEIENAFAWLNDVSLDFRHTIYSYLKKEKVFDKLNGLLNLPTDTKNNSNKSADYKAQSTNLKTNVNKLFAETNNKILEIIQQHDHTKKSFQGIVELFTEILVRFDGESKTDNTYKTFYKYFRDRIETPKDTVDWKSMLEQAHQAERLVNELSR